MIRRCYLLLLIGFSMGAWAQFDNYGGVDEKSVEEGKNPTTPSLRIETGDVKALAQAKDTRDEELFVRAASKILGRDQNNL
ncbi:MAG: hypothetical protein KDD34_09755 [Bdellovibrionales bacterium]|nr:hypothetical protein [Bdellovibrionales bacterium]